MRRMREEISPSGTEFPFWDFNRKVFGAICELGAGCSGLANERSNTYGLMAEPARIAGLRREREAVCRVKRYSRSRDSITYLPLNRTLATAWVKVRIHMPSTSAKLMKMCRSCSHQEGFLAGVPSTRRIL